MNSNYRELFVKNVVTSPNFITVFFSNSEVSLDIPNADLNVFGIKAKDIVPGKSLLVLGNKGNEDIHIQKGIGVIRSLKLAA